MEGYWWGGGKKRIEKRVQGLRNIIGKVQNRQGEVTNSTGNGEAKELTCMTHGHELSGGRGYYWREWGVWVKGGKEGKIGTTVIV